MPTLKEIKARIGSVQQTLKITSVMKMVASAKFHRAQSSAKAHAIYYEQLNEILKAVCSKNGMAPLPALATSHQTSQHAIVLAFASDNSLCGRFNANAIRALDEAVHQLRNEGFSNITVIPVGEKIRQATVKAGYAVDLNLRAVAGKDAAVALPAMARVLVDYYVSGAVDCVMMVYNHFYSMGHQEPFVEKLLPLDLPPFDQDLQMPDYIFEPDPRQLLERLLPTILHANLTTRYLDAAMAEHAARTVAMQTATDNAQELLDELSLSYNKQRQQAITNELADITQGKEQG